MFVRSCAQLLNRLSDRTKNTHTCQVNSTPNPPVAHQAGPPQLTSSTRQSRTPEVNTDGRTRAWVSFNVSLLAGCTLPTLLTLHPV